MATRGQCLPHRTPQFCVWQSGDIGFPELQAAIKAINPSADDATIEAMLTVGDADGDGEVSFEEFKEIILGEAA